MNSHLIKVRVMRKILPPSIKLMRSTMYDTYPPQALRTDIYLHDSLAA